MRAKKPSALPTTSMLLEVLGYTAMGVAFGLGFAFVVTHIAQLGIVAYIEREADPQGTITMLVITCATTFGVGATLTGLALTIAEKE